MGRSLEITLTIMEAVMTLLMLISAFLWLLLNLYYVNYKMGWNRKKMVKLLRREGLPEYASIKIAGHMFPKMELSPWRLLSLIHEGDTRWRRKPVGEQDR